MPNVITRVLMDGGRKVKVRVREDGGRSLPGVKP